MKFRILVLRVLVSLLLGGLTLDVGNSFAAGSHDSVADLTRQLLTLQMQSQRGDAAVLGTAATSLVSVAAARQERLAALIADHPELVLRHALPGAVRATLPSAVQPYLEEELSIEGELEVLHEDSANGSRYFYTLQGAGQRVALYFAADAPVLQTGDRVRAVGVRVGQAMAVASGQSQLTMLSLASPNTFGAQKTAVILVNFQDHPTQTWVSLAQARDIVFATDPAATSVTNFYLEASYRQAWLSGDVYGIYTIPMTSTGCNYASIATYAKQAATADAEARATPIATYTRFVYAFPSSGCSWWGLGTVGGNPSQAWINGSFQNGVVAHEMGHNFGLFHSHGLDCGAASIGSSCTSNEYGDVLDVMGSASPPKHFNAVQKELLGWLNYGASPPLTTVQTSGVYTLDPYESPGNNPKALKMKTPAGDWYYVEYRQAIGFDASTVSTNPNVRDGIVIHLWSQQSPNGIYLLDMTPETASWFDPALDLNASFSDQTAGITIAPVWVNGNTAGVNVTVGGGVPTCVRSNPTVAVSPAQQQGPRGTSASYTVAMTNRDNTACPASTFASKATSPAGWTATFVAPTTTIAPGATASTTTMQVTSPTSASSGSYVVSLTVLNTSVPPYSGSTTAMFTVVTDGGPGTFTDTFIRADSSILGNGWTQVSGNLMIQDDQAHNAPKRMSHTAVRAALVGETQTASASFASVDKNSSPRFGLIVRYKDPQNYYTCYRQIGGSSVFRIAKVVNGVETILKSSSIQNPAKGVFFSFDCHVQGTGPGTTLTLSFNGAIKLTVSDATSTFASGSVGMSVGFQSGGTSAPLANAVNKFTATAQ